MTGPGKTAIDRKGKLLLKVCEIYNWQIGKSHVDRHIKSQIVR
jgi:hypothetical protein